jgi:hypothetical protein
VAAYRLKWLSGSTDFSPGYGLEVAKADPFGAFEFAVILEAQHVAPYFGEGILVQLNCYDH